MGMTESSEGVHVFETGDRATIMRGKLKGQEVQIMGPAANDEYPVKLVNGDGYAVVNAVNLKAPAEGTIGAGKLAAEIQTAASDLAYGDHDPRTILQSLVSRLEADLPGLGGRVSWPEQVREV